ncbi:MAG: secondary thiamine-phosphate synthase enzyme YjbQ [Candidatus Omnitrophota bacterium]|nr:secondary thiamine-phosphate synthase enzyme YjbQ [Candidatus Omnitrophota bacterium]
MKVVTEYLNITTKGEIDIIDVTEKIEDLLKKSKLKNGIVNISCMGSTSGITTCEDEQGLLVDLKNTIERLIPRHKGYEHDKTLDDGNAHSHLRSSLFGSTITVPFVNAELKLGTWQQIVFLEFDNRPRQRKIALQFLGE